MTVCTIAYNASTGTNTGASGSRVPATPWTQADFAAISGTGAGTTFTFDSGTHDLTSGEGVADDGTDVLYVTGISNERHLFRITAFAGGASACTGFTVTPALGATTINASNWAIGGIRNDFDQDGTRLDFADIQAGWDFELEDTADFVIPTIVTPITLPGVGDLTDGPFRMLAAAGATPTITWTEDTFLFSLSANLKMCVDGVETNNTTSTNTSASPYRIAGADVYLKVLNTSSDSAGAFVHQAAQPFRLIANNCDVQGSVTGASGFFFFSSRGYYHIHNCNIHDHAGVGILDSSSSGFGGGSVIGNNIWNCAQGGMRMLGDQSNMSYAIKNNVFHGNTGPGLEINGTLVLNMGPLTVTNNLFTENSTYGILVTTPTSNQGGSIAMYEDNNAFRNNTAGETSGFVQGANDVTLTADPYTDEASDDFTLNDTEGGGALCRNAGQGYSG